MSVYTRLGEKKRENVRRREGEIEREREKRAGHMC